MSKNKLFQIFFMILTVWCEGSAEALTDSPPKATHTSGLSSVVCKGGDNSTVYPEYCLKYANPVVRAGNEYISNGSSEAKLLFLFSGKKPELQNISISNLLQDKLNTTQSDLHCVNVHWFIKDNDSLKSNSLQLSIKARIAFIGKGDSYVILGLRYKLHNMKYVDVFEGINAGLKRTPIKDHEYVLSDRFTLDEEDEDKYALFNAPFSPTDASRDENGYYIVTKLKMFAKFWMRTLRELQHTFESPTKPNYRSKTPINGRTLHVIDYSKTVEKTIAHKTIYFIILIFFFVMFHALEHSYDFQPEEYEVDD